MGFLFRNNRTTAEATERLVKPFKLSLDEKKFVDIKTKNLYERILTRCFYKTAGINSKEEDKIASSVWFSVEQGSERNGTIPLLARAMTNNCKIYLTYEPNLSLVRESTSDERTEIDEAYKTSNNAIGTIKNGNRVIMLDFSKYELTHLIKLYMSLIYSVLDSGNTQVKLAQSVQIKINELRKNISNLTSDDAIKQAKLINDSVKDGKSILIDALDKVEQTAINSDSIEKTSNIFFKLLASDISLPLSFVSGELTSGMSVTGEADVNYEDNGIKTFWTQIWRPVMIKLYNQKNVKYRTDRWRNLETKVRVLTYIENSDLFTDEQKVEFAQDIYNGDR